MHFNSALVIAIIISVIEQQDKKKREKQEQRSLTESINRQNKILSDIKRSFYAISSIDVEITFEMSAISKHFKQLKPKLNNYIAEHRNVYVNREFPFYHFQSFSMFFMSPSFIALLFQLQPAEVNCWHVILSYC